MTDYKSVVRTLQEDRAALEGERARIEERCKALDTAIADIKRLLQLENGTAGPQPKAASSLFAEEFPPELAGAFDNREDIVSNATKFLRIMGEPQSNRKLVDGLLFGGLKTNAQDPGVTIRSILRRAMIDKGLFVWSGGKWGLPDWDSSGGHASSSESQRPSVKPWRAGPE